MLEGARHPLGHARTATLREIIDLDTMKLAPGSVLHLRVVAVDANDVTGPGRGVSETRTLRVAEPLDSVSVSPVPPLPIDSMWVSQRLLNMRTDTLVRTRRRLARAEVVRRSTDHAASQEDIRRRTLAVIALVEDDGVGGTFETAVSTKLREAADLMWTARAHLAVAEPDSALPHMRRILAILDELRLANRYYLRGLSAPVAVNVERVRLTGTDTGHSAPRTPRAAHADPRAALAARVDAAVALARRDPRVALDSLAFIQVSAMRTAPALGRELGAAIERARRGEPLDRALERARRLLEPPARPIVGPAGWGGIVP